MKHDEWELLSAFIDGELTPQERTDVQAHLTACPDCSKELRALTSMQNTAAAAPRHALPPALLARLEANLSEPTWIEHLSQLLRTPRISISVGAAATLAVGLLLWTGAPDRDEIALEPLLAAHGRYCAEGLTPQENLVHPEFIARLAAIHVE